METPKNSDMMKESENNYPTKENSQNEQSELNPPVDLRETKLRKIFKYKHPLYLKITIATIIVLALAVSAALIDNKVNGHKFIITPVTKEGVVNPKTTSTSQTPSPTLEPIILDAQHKYTVDLQQNPSCESKNPSLYCKADIYLKDEASGKKTFFMTINNVEHDSRMPQFVNEKLFLIKRFYNISGESTDSTYSSGPNATWTEELWIYDTNRAGTKIYTAKGLSFIVNDNATQVAVKSANSPADLGKFILLKLDKNLESTKYQIDTEKCIPDAKTREVIFSTNFREWNKENDALWGDLSGEYAATGCFWKLNTSTDEFSYFPIVGNVEVLTALNTTKLVAVYQDFPPFVDKDAYDNWVSTHPNYSIYLYDLDTTKSTKIDTFSTSFTQALVGIKWTSENTLQYQSPNGTKTYTTP